nr:MAG: ORF3 [Torque teno polar bear virus 18]
MPKKGEKQSISQTPTHATHSDLSGVWEDDDSSQDWEDESFELEPTPQGGDESPPFNS